MRHFCEQTQSSFARRNFAAGKYPTHTVNACGIMSTLLIENIRLPNGNEACILAHGGRIAAVSTRLETPPDAVRLDGRGWLALPAAIDWHVHFREPGGEHKETLWSGSRAAVKGGVATCGEMPNTRPPTTTLRALEDRLARAEGCPAHLYFHFGAEPDNLAEVRAVARHPRVKALKIFMGPSTGQGGLPPAAVEAHFRQCAEIGLPVIVHAEDVERIQAHAGRYPALAARHGDWRPLEAELAAVRQALALAAKYPVRLCLAHTTSARVVELVERSGIRERVFVEAAAHHLVLAAERIAPPEDNRYKVNPPLRPESERAALFRRLVEGIDGLSSDHAPHTLAEKAQPYLQAPSGIPGVEYQFPLALTWWRQGHINLPRLLSLSSGNVARFFDLNKGELEPGKDADIALVDPEACWTIGAEGDAVASKCGWTLYGGMAVHGRVEATIAAGRVVWTRTGGWTDADRPEPATRRSGDPGAGDSCCE
jgi:dihydroorotase